MKKLPSDVKQVFIVNLKLISTSDTESLLHKVLLADLSCLNYLYWVALCLGIITNFLGKKTYNNRVQRTGNRRQYCLVYPICYYPKQRKANFSQSKWSYAELDNIHYKAVMNYSSATKVAARDRSQSIPCYRQKNKHYCLNQGMTIRCGKKCVFELYADLVGGRNVTMRTLLLRQDGCNTGLFVTVLNRWSFEAKTQQQTRKSTRDKEMKKEVTTLQLLTKIPKSHLSSCVLRQMPLSRIQKPK